MSSQHSNSFPPALSTNLALTLGAFSTLAVAQTAAAPASPLGTVEVRSTREAPAYQPAAVQSPKLTQPLRDTPQSINVVPAELIREQNAQSLQEVLQNVPGITFTSGEGNLGWGDFFTLRGFSAEQAITIDGVRDGGMASRTDTFNLEQAEVYKGTGSVESGVSAVGGMRQPGQQGSQARHVLQQLGGRGQRWLPPRHGRPEPQRGRDRRRAPEPHEASERRGRPQRGGL